MDTGNESTTPLFAKSTAASQPFNERKWWLNIFALVSQGPVFNTMPHPTGYGFSTSNPACCLSPILSVPARPRRPIKQGTWSGITALSLVYVYFRGCRHGGLHLRF